MSKHFNPRIYVTCLAAYNNGYYHGTWIDATQSVEAINEEIQAMLKKSPLPHAEEWAIHDHNDFGNHLSEYENLETVTQIASFIVAQGKLGMALLDHANHDVSVAERLLEECCCEGKHENERKFAYQLLANCYEIPEYLEYYIDYDRVARDLFVCDLLKCEL
jgi:antirestriction protein